jgi:hypothetical protein
VAHQIAQGSETRAQILLRVGKRKEGAVFTCIVDGARKRWAPGLDSIESKTKHVRVPVNEAWQNGGHTKVNHLGAGRDLYAIGWADRRDLVLFDKNDLSFRDLARLAIE